MYNLACKLKRLKFTLKAWSGSMLEIPNKKSKKLELS